MIFSLNCTRRLCIAKTLPSPAVTPVDSQNSQSSLQKYTCHFPSANPASSPKPHQSRKPRGSSGYRERNFAPKRRANLAPAAARYCSQQRLGGESDWRNFCPAAGAFLGCRGTAGPLRRLLCCCCYCCAFFAIWNFTILSKDGGVKRECGIFGRFEYCVGMLHF